MLARNRELAASGELVNTGRGGVRRRSELERERAAAEQPSTAPTGTMTADDSGELPVRRLEWEPAKPAPPAAPAVAGVTTGVGETRPTGVTDPGGASDPDPAPAPLEQPDADPPARGGFLAGLLEGLRA